MRGDLPTFGSAPEPDAGGSGPGASIAGNFDPTLDPERSDLRDDADCFSFYADMVNELQNDLNNNQISPDEYNELMNDAYSDFLACREKVEQNQSKGQIGMEF